MRPRLSIPALLAVLLGVLALGLVYADPVPQGPEPDLPRGNGELAAVSGLAPDGRGVTCFAWVTKVTGVKLDLFYLCYDAQNLAVLAARTAGADGPAPAQYAGGRLNIDEPRGAIHGTLFIVGGQLWASWSSPNDETTQVDRQELGARPLGVALSPAQTILPVRADLSPVVTP